MYHWDCDWNGVYVFQGWRSDLLLVTHNPIFSISADRYGPRQIYMILCPTSSGPFLVFNKLANASREKASSRSLPVPSF